MKNHYILMADIIGSSQAKGKALMQDFKKIVATVNKDRAPCFLSPMTITLGDEFQSVVTDLAAGIGTIIALEETIREQQKIFKLRYVLHYGPIDTPINPEIAYEMLGQGLTEAREKIDGLKHTRNRRFHVSSTHEKTDALLNNLLYLYQSVVDDWRLADYPIVTAFLQYEDYKLVAEKMGKVPSLLWKREKSLKIKEYYALKETIGLVLDAYA